MIPPDYLALRLIRHYLPASVTRIALRRRILVQPGLESRDPAAAAAHYIQELERQGRRMPGATVMILGFGGYFGVAVALLELGARHVTLCDPYARLDHAANARLAGMASKYLRLEGGRVLPDPAWITLLPLRISEVAGRGLAEDLDLVLSWSVYEHLVDPDGVTAGLARLTAPAGCNLHFIDLRDHFFRHPFEMLCHGDQVWKKWLNPSSNLNRWRAWQYQEVLGRHFDQVRMEAAERDLPSFLRVRDRVRPEFLSGDDQIDSATRLMAYAAGPRAAM